VNLLNYIQGIDNWKSLNEKLLKDDDNQIKGDVFEKLTKYYLLFKPEYISLLKNVWLGSEIPDRINKKLGIPPQDQGIDLIAQTHEGEFWSIQCKYHGDNKRKISHREVSTFLSLSFSVAKGIQHAIVCTTADDYAKLYRGIENIGFVLSDEWNKLGKEFFNFVRACESKKEVKRKAPFKPFKHQKRALKNAKQHFLKENNTRGKLVFPCGAGKSLTGYWITRELKAKNIIIAVPSLALVKQTLEVYLEQSYSNYESLKWLCVCSDEGIGKADDVAVYTQDIGVPCVTDTDTIAEWLIKNKSKKTVVFTTYQSGEKIAEASRKAKMSFDLGIMDEAHKTVGASDKLFSHLLFEKNISIDKRIFMTATERRYEGSSEDILSMDDPDMYGDTFEQMSFKEAIESNILCDYKIITLFISDNEVKNLIDDNVLVKPKGSRWNEETEARTLASLIALRKAVKKYNINHSVTFHSSIARADAFMQSQEPFTEKYKEFSSVDAFHVAGSMPTAQRSKIIDAFATSKKAIITNARCLTEGVDVPSIDGILFADPKSSKIDIVQAVGRALRKSKGKEFGYVILPVFTKSKTKEEVINSDAFQDILMMLRALASNDERIIEYFRDKSSGKTSSHDSVIQFDIDEQLADVIDEQQLVEQLELSTWEKLAKISWRPFEKVKEYIQKFEFKSTTEFKKAWKEGRLAFDIPSKPRRVYKDAGWISMPDFLGYDDPVQDWRPFNEARKFVRSLGLKSESEWRDYSKSDEKPIDIPKSPSHVYAEEGFISMPDFLGYKNKFQEWLSYDEALKFVHTLGLKTTNEWRDYTKTKSYNYLIPKAPNSYYKNKGWVDYGTWLGTGRKSDWSRRFLSFTDARAKIRKFNLKSQDEFNALKDTVNFPSDIPRAPDQKYDDTGEWMGWPDFLGYVYTRKVNYLSFKDAREKIRSFNFLARSEWDNYCDTIEFPSNIPKTPRVIYEGEWISMNDWLGIEEIDYLPYEEVKNITRKLKVKTSTQWRNYFDEGKLPQNVPKSLDSVYEGEGWVDWYSFFGKRNPKLVVTYNEAKIILKNYEVGSKSEWKTFKDSDNFPLELPKSPSSKYKNKGWISWGDFLGTGTIAPQNKTYVDFESARSFVSELGLDSVDDWHSYSKSGKRPSDIPSNPDKKYQDQWKGWDDFLGKNKK